MTPFKGNNRVTSPFGPRVSPISGKSEIHRGQDIITDGAWTVRECTGGTVLRVTSDNWRGNYVDVQTKPGTFERYQHLESIAVKVGQSVPQGAIIGIAGSTGDSTGRHLHFGVYRNGSAEANAVNPSAWSDVPNVVGIHRGNSNIDGDIVAKNTLYEYNGIVASQGDAVQIESMLNAKGIPFTRKEILK